MQTISASLVALVFFGVGVSAVSLLVEPLSHLPKKSVLVCQNGKVTRGSLEIMSKHADAKHADAKHADATTNPDEKIVIATGVGPIALGIDPMHIPLLVSEGRTLASWIKVLGPDRHVYLVLKDLRTANQPGVLYHLYLDLPRDTRPSKNGPHYIGTFNFFNADESGNLKSSAFETSSFFTFDITEIVRNLRAQNLLGDRTTITISPSGTPAVDANPMIGRIELVQE